MTEELDQRHQLALQVGVARVHLAAQLFDIATELVEVAIGCICGCLKQVNNVSGGQFEVGAQLLDSSLPF